MNAIILPYKNGSRSGAALANALGVRQIRLAGSTIHRQRAKTVINWGNSGRNLPPQGIGTQHTVINTTDSVSSAANKVYTFNLLYDGGVSIPKYTTHYETALGWFSEGEGTKVVERHTLTGHSGEGIVIAEDVDALSDSAPLYVKYVKKQDEYRVHIVAGQVIDVQRKARRSDVPDEDVNWQVRNHQNGFCYMRENVEPARDVIEQAVDAIDALRLDFGAVDVIWNNYQGKAYVLEVNTACGLEGTTLERYTAAFQELMMTGEVTPLEGYDFSEEDLISTEEGGVPVEATPPPMSEPATDETDDSESDEGTPPDGARFQVGDSVSISPSSQYYGPGDRTNPINTVGEIIHAGEAYVGMCIRVLWSNGETNVYTPSDLISATSQLLTAGSPELTPETLREGMRLRALKNRFFGTSLRVGDVVTVSRAGIHGFLVTDDGGMRYCFNVQHLNGEYFELIDDGVVQQEQEVVQEERASVEEVEYTSEYPRHYDENFPIGCAVEVTAIGESYPGFPWARTRNFSVADREIGVVVGCSVHRYTRKTLLAVRDSRGEIFVIATQGVRRVGTSTISVTQPRSDITPPRAPLGKWLVAVDGNVNLEEGVFDTQEEAEMALVSSDFHNMRQLGHDVRVVSL